MLELIVSRTCRFEGKKMSIFFSKNNEDFFKEAVECRERFALISSDCKKKIIEFQHPKDLRWY